MKGITCTNMLIESILLFTAMVLAAAQAQGDLICPKDGKYLDAFDLEITDHVYFRVSHRVDQTDVRTGELITLVRSSIVMGQTTCCALVADPVLPSHTTLL